MPGKPHTPRRNGQTHQTHSRPSPGISHNATHQEGPGPDDCTRCVQNWPYITYIIGILNEISNTKYRYSPYSCTLHRCRTYGNGKAIHIKSCEELDYGAGTGSHYWEPSAPQIISEPHHTIMDASEPLIVRIKINFEVGLMIIDGIYRQTIKFDPTDHEAFRANLTNALQEARAGGLIATPDGTRLSSEETQPPLPDR
jgi:hypothetical protein